MKIIGNHVADREELNRLLSEYQNTVDMYHETLLRAAQHRSNAMLAVSGSLAGEDTSMSDIQEAQDNKQAIRQFWDGMVDADNTAKNLYSNSQEEISVLSSNLQDFISAIGANGSGIGTMNINQLRTNVYSDQAMFDYLANKLSIGEHLSYEERDLLYGYIQDEVFGEDGGRDIRSIVNMIEYNPDRLVERLNNRVLASEADLAKEIAMVELYLFTGNERPEDHVINGTDAANMSAYLAMLRNFQKHINVVGEHIDYDRGPEDPLLARVEYIDHEVGVDPIKITLNSELTLSYTDESSGFTREEFLAIDQYFGGNYVANPEIEYYYGRDAVNDLQRAENLQNEAELASYRSDFIGEQAMQALISGLTKGSAFTGPTLALIDYHKGMEKLKEDITIGEAKLAAMDLDLELQLTTDRVVGDKEFEIQLRPTDSTLDILNRWEEIESLGANIPFPGEQIEHQDWKAISEFLNENKSEFINSNEDIYNYIMFDDLEEGMTAKDLVE